MLQLKYILFFISEIRMAKMLVEKYNFRILEGLNNVSFLKLGRLLFMFKTIRAIIY